MINTAKYYRKYTPPAQNEGIGGIFFKALPRKIPFMSPEGAVCVMRNAHLMPFGPANFDGRKKKEKQKKER